jgi:hypothetical protein
MGSDSFEMMAFIEQKLFGENHNHAFSIPRFVHFCRLSVIVIFACFP